jgi:hypothetical protein
MSAEKLSISPLSDLIWLVVYKKIVVLSYYPYIVEARRSVERILVGYKLYDNIFYNITFCTALLFKGQYIRVVLQDLDLSSNFCITTLKLNI